MADIGIDYLKIKRAILHKIIEKTHLQPHATTELNDELIGLTPSVEDIFHKRIIQATGMESKSFILDVKDDNSGSFFDMAKTLFFNHDEDFIRISQDMCNLLAEKQKRLGLKGGYFILIEGYNTTNNFPMLIVIKAETQEVLQQIKKNQKTMVQVLDEVFLSPAQKLFKIGVLSQIKGDLDGHTNLQNFKGLLFDSQFSGDSNPAEYFYKEFLGYGLDENDKYRTREFYKKTSEFLKDNFDGIEYVSLVGLLKGNLSNSTKRVISPSELGDDLFVDDLMKDKFTYEIETQFPSSFIKDLKLIENRLKQNSLNFSNDIKVSGPQDNFSGYVEVISDLDEISQEDIDNKDYTIVKIRGTINGKL